MNISGSISTAPLWAKLTVGGVAAAGCLYAIKQLGSRQPTPPPAAPLASDRVTFIKTDSMGILERLTVDEDTLVIFDVHMTLYQPNDPDFWMKTFVDYQDLMQEVTRGLTPEENARMLMLMAKTNGGIAGQSLLDPNAPAVVAALQAKGANVIACTASLAEGEAGKALRDELIAMNFHFTHGKNVTLPLNFAGVDCTFTDGVLTSNTLSKGDVVSSWLETLDWKPKRVIMVDDKLKHLQSIAGAVPEGVEFTGVEFTRSFSEDFKRAVDRDHLRQVWGALAEEAKRLTHEASAAAA